MIGTILGDRYEILEKIGSGGMGDVFKAHDRRLDRIVAIKILKSEYNTDENFIRKFKRESLAAASISHPNIVSIYDVGVNTSGTDTIYYIVMEYIEGRTLKEIILEEGPIAQNRALNYTIQIAEALKVAHSKNIVHRDIKSQNIMVTGDNRVKVTDFGIARVAGNSTVTMTNAVMGSVHYFSPEQAKGAKVDNRSDIYSLGIVLFEMLTGDVPYDAENPISVALMHIQEPQIKPSTINPKVTPGADAIVEKMTMKNPRDRYESVDYIIRDIKDLLLNRRTPIREGKNTIPIGKREVQGRQDLRKEVVKRQEDKKGTPPPQREYAPSNYEFKEPPKKRKSSGTFLGVLTALLLFGLIIGGSYLILLRDPGEKNTPETASVLNVIGQNLEEGRARLEEEGFVVAVNPVETLEQNPNVVIDQEPKEGVEMEKGSTVTLSVTATPKSVPVPDITGMTPEEAKQTLSTHGLRLGSIRDSEYSEEIGAGKIIRTSPEPGSPVEPGTAINVYPSKGPEQKMAIVPNITGISKEDAKKYLEENKLILGDASEEYNEDVKKGLTFYQQYRSGDQIPEGTTVDIKVSLGKKPDPEPSPVDIYEKNVDLRLDLPEDGEEHEFEIIQVHDGEKKTIKRGSIDSSEVITVSGKTGDSFMVYIDGKHDHTVNVE